MPNITNRVLTTPGQQLSAEQKRNARVNINAMEKAPLPSGDDKEYVMCARDGKDILISNEVPVLLDSTSPKTADRHAFATLVLSGNAQKFNGGNIRLRIRERVDGAGDVMKFSAEQADYLLRRGMVADDGFDF